MSRVDNLNDPTQEIRDLMRRVRALETATPMSHASIGRNGLRVYDGGVITVENGGLDVTGTAAVSGTLTVSGTETVTGTTNLNGPVNISGATSLVGTLTVGTGGTIGVAGMTIGKQIASGIGGITWGASYPSLYSDTSSVAIGASLTKYVSVSTGGPAMVNGSRVYAIDATSHQMVGAATTSNSANVYLDSSTSRLYLISSARRFKIRPRKMKLVDALLDVPVKDWIDKGARKRGEPDVRIPGVIAEEVEAAGGEQFVTYGKDGVIEGVAYDRLALARTQILADRLAETNKKLDRAMETIAELTRRLDAA